MEVKISKDQLNVLLNEVQKEYFDAVLKQNVFCGTCGSTAKQGVDTKELILDALNDIRIKGICNVCKGDVVRILEFGENQEFHEKAMNYKISRL
ncbi:hypothetical protein U1E44_06580 [Arenibacter sp. GZD96]|uniref:hypothetical protein n=1 Tax=Aurantibrevibacter litoralis TaxID=3106030 RepID=UPI002AFF1659|nr:hypothetical protein [Arenibacter sp. GZD-96]MEA1785749.1 hypothetical protein [Arenibacter sp. GZD-96]